MSDLPMYAVLTMQVITLAVTMVKECRRSRCRACSGCCEVDTSKSPRDRSESEAEKAFVEE